MKDLGMSKRPIEFRMLSMGVSYKSGKREWDYKELPYEYFDHEHGLYVDDTLSQFTGLLDKNGTKIFEGDIIRTDDSVLSDEAVVYDDAQYPALLWAGDQGVKESNRIKVIGNIHENPELLSK